MIKQKGGNLLGEEGLKILVAFVCIGFLIYFITSWYLTGVFSNKLKHAKALLNESQDSLRGIIERVRTEKISQEKLVHNPRGWYLFSFVSGDLRPNSCAGENCLCVCENAAGFNLFDPFSDERERQSEECTENGACLVVKELKKFKEIRIVDPTNLLIKYDQGIVISRK